MKMSTSTWSHCWGKAVAGDTTCALAFDNFVGARDGTKVDWDEENSAMN